MGEDSRLAYLPAQFYQQLCIVWRRSADDRLLGCPSDRRHAQAIYSPIPARPACRAGRRVHGKLNRSLLIFQPKEQSFDATESFNPTSELSASECRSCALLASKRPTQDRSQLVAYPGHRKPPSAVGLTTLLAFGNCGRWFSPLRVAEEPNPTMQPPTPSRRQNSRRSKPPRSFTPGRFVLGDFLTLSQENYSPTRPFRKRVGFCIRGGPCQSDRHFFKVRVSALAIQVYLTVTPETIATLLRTSAP